MDLSLSSEMSIAAVLLFGFLLGLKHAVEADHLAAVSTIVAERRNLLSSAIVGGFWGLGHTFSLLGIGALVILLKLRISESIEAKLEAAVGVMLVLLGVNALRKLWSKSRVHIHTHDHDGHEHTHVHAHEDNETTPGHHVFRFTPRSILIGMVHGLAGSAALMLLIVPTIRSTALALLYILVFGIGSIGGMMIMSLVLGVPMYLTQKRFTAVSKILLGVAGLFSLGLGLFVIYEKTIL